MTRKFIAGRPTDETLLDLVFESGRGALLTDVDGNRFVDFCNCLNLAFGHEWPPFMGDNFVVNSSNYMTHHRQELLQELTIHLPFLDGFQFRSSGTEAVEAALRYAHARTVDVPLQVFAFEGAYHGLTSAAQELMGQRPMGFPVDVLPFPDSAQLTQCIDLIAGGVRNGPTLIALETVQGSTLRALPVEFLSELCTLRQNSNAGLLT